MEYICGAYDRLSDADCTTDESSSIQSQKIIIDSFAKFNNLKIYKHYVDDGYSGGNFDRPAFREMINDIESHKINCVITKDLSRLGREMYETGKYIEEYFLEKGIRYIAINDSYDSNIGDAMLGIRLSINDLYLRDVSKKVKMSLRAKQNRGDYIGSFALYGYKKSLINKHKLVVDEKVRYVIELIYDMALEGNSPNKIAEYLTLKQIPIPIVYKKDPRAVKIKENNGMGIWRRQTITGILTNQMYIGNMVQNTHYKISYNSKKMKKASKNENIIVKNTHEGIISKEIFDKVQKILNNKSVTWVTNQQLNYLLGGLIFCHECGRNIRISKDILKFGIRHYTQCNLYTRKGKYGICSSHRINYDWLEEDIIDHLRGICKEFCMNYDLSSIICSSNKIIGDNLSKINKKINILFRNLESNTTLMDTLYNDKVKGIIDEEMFKRNYARAYEEKIKIRDKLDELRIKKSNYENDKGLGDVFKRCKKNIENYLSFRNISKELIVKLIDHIEIDKDKNVYVYYRFSNCFK